MVKAEPPEVSPPTEFLRNEFSIGKGQFATVYKINHSQLDEEDCLYAAKHINFFVEGLASNLINNI